MRTSTIIAVGALSLGIIAVPTVASAANGGSWLLGRSNSETATTTVTNSAGTPLRLNAKSGYAPLSVNSTKVNPSFNADLLDGLHASSFLRSTGKAADADKVDGHHASSFAMRSARTGTIVHDGSYDGLGAVCPAGTVFASGGGFAKYGSAIVYSGPDWDAATGALIPNSWIVLDDSGVGVSNVTCYSPSGAAVPGAATTIDQVDGTTSSSAGSPSLMSAERSEASVAKLESLKAAQAK